MLNIFMCLEKIWRVEIFVKFIITSYLENMSNDI